MVYTCPLANKYCCCYAPARWLQRNTRRTDRIQTVQTYTHTAIVTSSSRHWCPRRSWCFGSRCSRSGFFAGCRWQRCRCLRNCCHLQITFKLNARWWPKSRKHNACRQRPRRAARTTGRYVDDRRSAYTLLRALRTRSRPIVCHRPTAMRTGIWT